MKANKDKGTSVGFTDLNGNSEMFTELLHISLGKATWIYEIEKYCKNEGIEPILLIEDHEIIKTLKRVLKNK